LNFSNYGAAVTPNSPSSSLDLYKILIHEDEYEDETKQIRSHAHVLHTYELEAAPEGMNFSSRW
jgi:hypothetical protein